MSLSDKGRKRHVCAACGPASLRRKPSRLDGLQVEARQKVPEPRNNGSATEAEAAIKAGSVGGRGVSRLMECYPEGSGMGQTRDQVLHVLAE